MIVRVSVRRLKPGATFQDLVREWETDEVFGVPTRVVSPADRVAGKRVPGRLMVKAGAGCPRR